ncbi:MAG: hypothetical protein DMD28_04450 [Gemmatimonadetes bacterium]|nr:MAG: hypothetical protein DMD28_04450 [Gemmatimonadota bacterium]
MARTSRRSGPSCGTSSPRGPRCWSSTTPDTAGAKAVAVHTAARHPVAGLILESPFTSARDMARLHYRIFPRLLLHLRLDNETEIRRVRCPVLVFHGTADRLAPIEMGRRVAAAAPGPAELVAIAGAGHNDTYDVGGTVYRDKVWAFVLKGVRP